MWIHLVYKMDIVSASEVIHRENKWKFLYIIKIVWQLFVWNY